MSIAINTHNADQLLNEFQASEVLQIGVRTLQGWRVRGQGPRYRKLGRAVRYSRAELIEWADSRVVGSTSEQVAQ